MENLKEKNKQKNLTDLVVMLFTFLRVISFVSFERIGIVFDDAISLKGIGVTSVLSIAVFAMVASVFVSKISSFDKVSTKYLTVLFLADFIFFNTQISFAKLFLSVFLLCVFIGGNNKKLSVVTVPLYCLVSCAIASSSLFSFAILAVLIYAVMNISASKVKTAVVSFVSLLLSGVGFSINRFVPALAEFETAFSQAELSLQIRPYTFNDTYLLIFTIPAVIVFIWFVSEYFAAYNEDKKPEGNKFLIPVISFAVMALNFAAFFFAETEVISVISLVPVAVIAAMVISGNKYAQSALNKMNNAVKKNKSAFAAVLAVAALICVYFILKETEFSNVIIHRATDYAI